MQTFLMNGQTASEIKQSAVTFFCFPSLCDTHCERMGGEGDVPYPGSCLGRDSHDTYSSHLHQTLNNPNPQSNLGSTANLSSKTGNRHLDVTSYKQNSFERCDLLPSSPAL